MEECALCASSAHDVHHASVCVTVVIGVLVVHCELHVDVRVHVIPIVVCDDAVVDLTLGLIALVVIVVFVEAIFHRICCIGGILFTPPVGYSELRWLLPNCELYFCTKFILRIIPPRSIGAGSIVAVMLR